VDGLAEQPLRPTELVEFGKRPHVFDVEQEVSDGLDEVVADGCATGDVDDGESEDASVVPAEVVHRPHGVG
jgi:hypothetical protein